MSVQTKAKTKPTASGVETDETFTVISESTLTRIASESWHPWRLVAALNRHGS